MLASENILPGESAAQQLETAVPETDATVLMVDDDPRNLFAT